MYSYLRTYSYVLRQDQAGNCLRFVFLIHEISFSEDSLAHLFGDSALDSNDSVFNTDSLGLL